MKRLKILHLPTEVGGNSWGLAEGERQLGLDSAVLVSTCGWLGYPADIKLDLQKIGPKPLKLAKLLSAFLKIRNRYDVFHFNFGSSLIHYPGWGATHLELPFYPSKARIFATYNGCDARQKFPTMQRTKTAACHNPECYAGVCNSGEEDRRKKKAIEKMARYAKHIWAVNPDLLYFLPEGKSSFLPYSVCSKDEGVLLPKTGRRKLKIVHAPTNREAKGSVHILSALKRLGQTHSEFIEVRLVEGVPHADAVAIYKEADIIIDQILIGWYGAFAVEAMKMGKPVIARIALEDLKFLPPGMGRDVQAAFINAGPDTIYDTLLRCVEDRDILKRHSEAGLEYARKWHDARYIAGLVKEKYEAD